MSAFGIIILVLGIVAIIFLFTSLKIVRQASAVVVERLGKYNRTLETGVHMVIPFLRLMYASKKDTYETYVPDIVCMASVSRGQQQKSSIRTGTALPKSCLTKYKPVWFAVPLGSAQRFVGILIEQSAGVLTTRRGKCVS